MKAVTTPRMELTAATMAVRLATMIVREIFMTINKTYFWTDSLAVIRYILNERQRFTTIVANRINIISAGSHPDQWRHTGFKEDPANIASRGVERVFQLVNSELCWHGPTFFMTPESDWYAPHFEESYTLCDEDPEGKRVVAVTAVKNEKLRLFNHCSKCQI